MAYRLRDLDLDDKMCHQISLQIVEKIYPREIICEELSRAGGWEQRERRLSMLTLIYVLLAAALWTRLALPRVLEKLGRPLHLLGRSLSSLRISASTISYRREQLAVAPLQGLFERCCRPVCREGTIGAYRFGYRLVALDATVQDVADTQANAEAFARPSNQHGVGPFPQIRLLLLCECGSHAPIGAGVDTSKSAERTLAFDVLDGIEADMLVLHDAQFPSYVFWQALRARGAHVLAMLPGHHLTRPMRKLEDGSYLSAYHPPAALKRAGCKPLLVRVITYRITDPGLGEPEKFYRLGTTLLDPHKASALDLIDCSHERWEVEISFDEIRNPSTFTTSSFALSYPTGSATGSLRASADSLCHSSLDASSRHRGWFGPGSPQFY